MQALIAFETGDVPAALRLAGKAVALDEAAINAGRDSLFNLPSLLIRRSEIELGAQQPDLALHDARRALEELQRGAQPATYSSFAGQAYLALGRAIESQRKDNEARAAFQSAVERFRNTIGRDYPDARITRQRAVASR